MTVLRLAGRLANAFTLDLVKLSGVGRDVIDALLEASILDASLAHEAGRATFELQFATLAEDPPDHLRRPVTLNGVALSLQLPYETVRRRVGRLVEAGVCVRTPTGVIIPQATTSSRRFGATLQAQHKRLRTLYHRLDAIGALPDLPRAPARQGDPPLRLVGRRLIEYLLRFVDPVLEQVRDPLSALILLDIIRANTEAWPDTESGGAGTEPAAFVPDERRTAVSLGQLSTRLHLPYETLRRRVGQLEEATYCRAVSGGFIVPAEALARPEVIAFAASNYLALVRMFRELGAAGVLASWSEPRRQTTRAG